MVIKIEVIVYWDILFIINFIFNYISIVLTKLVANIPAKFWRISIAAVLGSVFQLYTMINKINLIGLAYIISSFILEIVVVLIVFGKLKVKKSIILIGLHMGINYLMGGIICNVYDKAIAYKRQEITMIEFILIGIITFLIIKYTLPIILRSIYYREKIYEVVLSLKGKEVSLRALLDTGNSLTEPTTGKKVTVVEKKIISKFNDIRIDKIFIIPYKSLGKDDGVLYGIEVDKLLIKYENYMKIYENAIIAIYSGDLSRDGRYNAILHSESLM